MKDPTSREQVMRWITGLIASEGENATWVAGTHVQITKVSLSFQVKVWWAIVRAQLWPTSNDNTFSPSLTLMVACLMAGYPVYVGRIIATEMRDRELNEIAELPFPYLIRKLCLQANIIPNKLVDKWTKAYKVTTASKIKDVTNHLFGAKAGPVGPLAFVPHIPVDMPQTNGSSKQGSTLQPDAGTTPPRASLSLATSTFVTIPTMIFGRLVVDQRQTRSIVDQILLRLPQIVKCDVLVAEKLVKDEMQKEFTFLKDMMDELEVHVQNQLQAAGSVNAKELKALLAEM
uniref:Putative plant transposon protein domain-containing protein n=1 Tax=Solanum tuberosum TaxID=4113 RepID=M1DTX8_SOLTU